MYKHINQVIPVKLATLIISGDIKSDTLIQIFDHAGNIVCKGEWYRDWILDHKDDFGYASKAGSGHTVKFILM